MLRILVSILLASLAWPAGGASAEDVPRFEPTPCPSFDLHDENAECGFLIVPENRDDPGKRTLRLAVAVQKSRSADPQPDPDPQPAPAAAGTLPARRAWGKRDFRGLGLAESPSAGGPRLHPARSAGDRLFGARALPRSFTRRHAGRRSRSLP